MPALQGVLSLAPLLLLCPSLVLGWTVPDSVVYTSANTTERRGEDGLSALVEAGDGKIQLKLCECERAIGAPNGLSCNKQGWFITSFERQGQWVAGGGFVPLNHAVCCRPCLPDELPPDPSGRIPDGQRPLGMLSLGCHPSTDELPVRCEGGGRSFATGFSESVRVFTTSDTYYPVNTINCCTPSLLLENGDAWELERCDCHDSHDPVYPVNCGGLGTDELLFGYIFYRMSPMGHIVPVGPAQCCKVCLSSTLHPMDQCDDLAYCNRNGVCNLGQCECFDGWTGPDCSTYAGGGGGGGGRGVPSWAITLIVLSSCALAGVFMVAVGHIIRVIQENEAGEGSEGGDERQPLLLRIDPDDAGSVGSQDTECEEEEQEEVQERVNNVIAQLEQASPGARGYRPAAVASEGGGTVPATPSAQSPRAPSQPHPPAAAAAPAAGEGAAGEGEHAPTTPGHASPRPGAASTAVESTGLEIVSAATVAAAAAAAGASSGAAVSLEGVGSGESGVEEALIVRLHSHPIDSVVGSPEEAAAEEAAADEMHNGVTAEATLAAAVPSTPGAGDVQAAEAAVVVIGDAPGSSDQEAAAAAGGKEEEEGEGELSWMRARRVADPLSPLSAVECIVCFSRPVQVVLVPCGHVCMCRRCSRKLHRCPVCRKDIVRRQKLYI